MIEFFWDLEKFSKNFSFAKVWALVELIGLFSLVQHAFQSKWNQNLKKKNSGPPGSTPTPSGVNMVCFLFPGSFQVSPISNLQKKKLGPPRGQPDPPGSPRPLQGACSAYPSYLASFKIFKKNFYHLKFISIYSPYF